MEFARRAGGQVVTNVACFRSLPDPLGIVLLRGKLEFVGLFGQWRAVPMRYTALPPALVRGVVPVRTLVPGGVRHPHIFHKKVR